MVSTKSKLYLYFLIPIYIYLYSAHLDKWTMVIKLHFMFSKNDILTKEAHLIVFNSIPKFKQMHKGY